MMSSTTSSYILRLPFTTGTRSFCFQRYFSTISNTKLGLYYVRQRSRNQWSTPFLQQATRLNATTSTPIDTSRMTLKSNPSSQSFVASKGSFLSGRQPTAPAAEGQRLAAMIPENVEVEAMEGQIAVKDSHNPGWYDQMPVFARTNKGPWSFPLFHLLMAIPILAGAVLVHILPVTTKNEWAREVLNWEIHYGAALLPFMAATHMGTHMTNFGIPQKSKYRGLYNVARYCFPPLLLTFGLAATMKSPFLPLESCVTLMSFFCVLGVLDYVAHKLCLQPSWMFKPRLFLIVAVELSMLLLCLSERMILQGRRVGIKI